jgi:hypothetical protein
MFVSKQQTAGQFGEWTFSEETDNILRYVKVAQKDETLEAKTL